MLSRDDNELLTQTGAGTPMGTSDTAIIQVRRRLMNAARALRDRGTPAPGPDPQSFHVRSASVVLPPGTSWIEGAMPRVMAKPGRQLTLA